MERGRELMGFISNDGLTMARLPGLLNAAADLIGSVYGPGRVPIETKRLVAMMSSQAAGCRYCKAHTRFGAERMGLDQSKLDALWEFEESDQFSEAEKAALRVAWLASLTPNQVEDGDMARLRAQFDDDQVVEIVGVIAMFGFLNRWNDTLRTEVEDLPAQTLENE